MNLRTWSVTEAHDNTGIPASSIRRLLEEGSIAGNRIGRVWRVRDSEVVAGIPSVETRRARRW